MKTIVGGRTNFCIICVCSILYLFLIFVIKRIASSIEDIMDDSKLGKQAIHNISISHEDFPYLNQRYLPSDRGRIIKLPEITFSSEWEKSQYERRSTLKANCRFYADWIGSIPSLQELILLPRNFLNNLIVDDIHRTIYCYIPKVACSQWKRIMMVLTGRVSSQGIDNIPHKSVHYNSGLRSLNAIEYSREDIFERLLNYKKFLIVRHPTERLLSAFNDKFNSNTSDARAFQKGHAVNMMKFSRDASDDIPENGEGMKFIEFLYYISSHNPAYLQEHWKPYLHLCYPCTINYDFIGKYETLETDSNQILEQINAPPELRFPEFIRSTTADNLRQILSSIPTKILTKLYNIYELDFSLFGYDHNVNK